MRALLAPRGRFPGVGPERGPRPRGHGIARYTDPYGSYRYVYYVDKEPVAALQVVSPDGDVAIIANVYTAPEYRRQGYAERLLRRAERDFERIEHASERSLSEEGRAWRDRTSSRRNPRHMPYERTTHQREVLERELQMAETYDERRHIRELLADLEREEAEARYYSALPNRRRSKRNAEVLVLAAAAELAEVDPRHPYAEEIATDIARENLDRDPHYYDAFFGWGY